MQTQTLLLIIAAAIASLGIVVFQYYYKSKKRGSTTIVLSILRFIGLLSILLLLINPKFLKQDFVLEKTDLLVLLDNSSSVTGSKETTETLVKALQNNEAIKEQFNVKPYRFDDRLADMDSLNFKGKNTNITNALASLNDIYTNAAVVMVTDGNQTIGEDYEFYGKRYKFPVFPIVVGDTTQFEDVRIDQVNANRYAFLKNKYPLEIFVSYKGDHNISPVLSVMVDGTRVYQEKVNLSATENTKIVNALLEAKTVGAKTVQVALTALPDERNVVNNTKNIAIEVIDEKTKVALISDMLHPDIGALTKAVESNEQRSVSLLKPTGDTKYLENYDLFILYQPNATFKAVYEAIQKRRANSLTITGTKTDWRFFKSIHKGFDIGENGIVQELTPIVNSGFTKYDISQFSFDGYPPLESNASLLGVEGEVDVMMNMQIRGIAMKSPLLFVTEQNAQKEAFVFGEHLWKWRMHDYREEQNFQNFDDFIGKLVLYLSDTKSKERLQVTYKAIFEGSQETKITAFYFDEAFVFDANANLTITIKETKNGQSKEIPMLLKGTYYEADLSDLLPGSYDFTVKVKDENRSKSGSFIILDFDVEQQFTSSNYKKLEVLASNTGGKQFYSAQLNELIQFVTTNERFRPIQRSSEKVVSLIDFRWLLGIIALAFALEWFIRKYNGLI